MGHRKWILCGVSNEKTETTFHRFPSDKKKQEEWCTILIIDINGLPLHAFICANHFHKSDLIEGKRTQLKHSAVPSVEPLRQTDDSSDEENEINLAQEIALSHSNSEQLESRNLPREQIKSPEVATEMVCEYSFPEQNRTTDSSTLAASLSGTQSLSESATLSASQSGTGSIPVTPQSRTHVSELDMMILNTFIEAKGDNEEHNLKENASDGEPPRKRMKTKPIRYFGDIRYTDLENPLKRPICWKVIQNTYKKQRKTIDCLRAKSRRQANKIWSLQALTNHLKRINMISENAQYMLDGSIAEDIFNKIQRGRKKEKYSAEPRRFALTVHFYSKKAYNYVRTKLNKILPHTSTITKSYATVNGSPGFLTEALQALKIKVTEARNQEKEILCNLVFDEMCIMKKVEWDGKRTYGYVELDIGDAGDTGDTVEEAREALVFMLVALNCSWKIPVGYFLINGLTGAEKANLLEHCLEFVHSSGVTVTSITFDGAPSNVAMCKVLGANFNVEGDFKSYFLHPITKDYIF
ncbi:unnamed protein product [Acanthoscelides obtectus]|uniref:THAP-type domain-containing protein n=1 Tax=Acanthoscelides obtectus TaxID=200917 RepID=A0A9P0PDN3_ACAOB|nr:unnamed protein product [Acanthoscelides obtectus]CAK1655921.1 DNA transposase THAP9 [Acanthoscelides obtectus]